MATIGLDIGTTGCKVAIVDEHGNTIVEHYYEYDLSFPYSGWVELDPEVVWNGVKTVLLHVAQAYSGSITAMAIASFGEAAVLLDKDSNVIANSIFYSDIRGCDCIDELIEMIDLSYIQENTGMPVNGMYTLLKLMWIKKNCPEIFERIHMILPFASFIGYRLTGEMVSDYSLASRTLMYNRHTMTWDEHILGKIGFHRDNLPRVFPSGKPISKLINSITKELKLPANILLVSGAHDQVAAAIGAGAVNPGEAVDGIGSAECITAVLPTNAELVTLHKYNICAEPHGIAGKFVSLIFNNTAGAALKWYRNCFEQELYAKCKSKGKNIYSLLNKTLSSYPSPLLFLPYLSGTGTPYMDADAKGILCGLTLSSTKPEIYRGILEGMNFEMKYNIGLLSECGLQLKRLTAVGGGASSKDALQIKSDILQIPIETLHNPQSGNIGLSILCAVAEGKYEDIQEAGTNLAKTKETIYPSSAYLSQYNDKYESYKRMYAAQQLIYGH